MTALWIQALESVGVKWNIRSTAWEDRLSELADYRKIYGHCNVPKCKSECTKLAKWVSHQRSNYKLHLEGKTSSMMTLSRIQELERLGFEWKCQGAAWEVRLSELADYRKLHGHCNVPRKYVQNSKLYWWVAKQRTNYRLHLEAKPSRMTLSRIQALERLGFEWAFEWESPPHARNATEYHNSQQLSSPNQHPNGIDCESLARKKKKRRLESQIPRYDPVEQVQTAIEIE
jgi:hypothetical protein